MTDPQVPGSPGASRDVQLAQQFVSLADTLVDDYDVVEVLDGLVRSCVELLGVDQAGLLLIDQRGNLQVMASSSEAARLVELLQLQAEEGPCVDCVREGLPITVDDLSEHAQRWPTFVQAAETAGFVSCHALPLRMREERIGGLNLFSSKAGQTMAAGELRIAQALADVATIGILQQRSISRAALLAEQLQSALNTRITIEQAKGILAERGGLDMETAFEHLRSYARNANVKLGAAAAAVVRGELPTDKVLASRSRRA